MKFYSTRDKSIRVTAKEAVLNGLAPDGGLYLPETIPTLEQEFLSKLSDKSTQEIALRIANNFFAEDLSPQDLEDVVLSAFNFPVPLHRLDETRSILELFHGPTLAFKDFGARFMARLTAKFLTDTKKKVVVLVATSGDTGGAVANGFYGIDGIQVVVLYPSGKVSQFQESQFANLGGNISAIEIDGTFDDCQRLVKQAFSDQDLRSKFHLASANSINISRLVPQSVYYFLAAKELNSPLPLVFSIPSGNFGNLTAGILAHRMGLNIRRLIASTNANDIVPTYLKIGEFLPRPSIQTISNAMDVGNPSNFERILDLFGSDLNLIREEIFGSTFSDDQTRSAMREIYARYEYISDPHTAVGYLGLKQFEESSADRYPGVILGTAHPIKFSEVVQETLGIEPKLPLEFHSPSGDKKLSTSSSSNYLDLKSFISKIN